MGLFSFVNTNRPQYQDWGKYKDYKNMIAEYKSNFSIGKYFYRFHYPELMNYPDQSTDYYLALDNFLKNNPSNLPLNMNQIVHLFLLGTTDKINGKYIGNTSQHIYNRIDSLKTVTNGIVTWPSWLTEIIPNPSPSTMPTEKMVLDNLITAVQEFENFIVNYVNTLPKKTTSLLTTTVEVFSNERQKSYFKEFLDGNVSLDYLKNVIIPERILVVDKDKDLPNFPIFLRREEDYSPFAFDSNFLLVKVDNIKANLLKVVDYIENSLFAQDIHTLNKLAEQVARSVGINNDAIAMLSSEQAKLQKLDEDFQKTLASAKQLQTVYDMLKNQSINAVDPVVQSQMELDKAIKSEMSALEAQYAEKARLLSLQKENELKAQQTALYNAQKAEEARIAEEKRLQEEAIRKAELEKQNLINQATSEAQTQKELTQWHNGNQATAKDQSKDGKSSTALPLIAVAGVLALVSLGGSNE